MVENRKLFYAISLMLLTCCQIITMLPHNAASSESISRKSNNTENNDAVGKLQHDNNNKNSDFLKIAAERIQKQQQQQQKQQTIVSNEDMDIGQQENDSSRPADNIDDLIFLDKRPINQQQQQQQLKHQEHEKPLHYQLNPQYRQHQEKSLNKQQLTKPNEQKNHFEFHHITLDKDNDDDDDIDGEGNSEEATESLIDTTDSSLIIVDDDEDVTDADGIPHEIELQPDINDDEVTPLNVTPLDLSDFLSLIPATKVKTIVNHYYHNDPEVQRAHAFMSSRDFLMLKQHIVAIPEMSAFLRYLNNSGLDLVKFVTALTNLTSYEAADKTLKIINSTSNPLTDALDNQQTTTTTIMAETNGK